MEPIKCNVKYDETIWAGNKLAIIRNREWHHEGTSWEISAHKTYSSTIENGTLKGELLTDALKDHKAEIMGNSGRLLRIAILDAASPLSIQVHPDDAYAYAHEDDEGKAESWYILDADPGASLVAGSDFKSKEEIRKAIDTDTIEDHLNHIPVKRGDFVAIPPGTLHALGAGILAIEVGTNSNTTYRFYDYHRKDAQGNERELHIEKSIDVVQLGTKTEKISSPETEHYENKVLTDMPQLRVTLTDVQGEYTFTPDGKGFYTLSNVGSDAYYICNGKKESLAYTQSILIPASSPAITIYGNTRILIGQSKGEFHEDHTC